MTKINHENTKWENTKVNKGEKTTPLLALFRVFPFRVFVISLVLRYLFAFFTFALAFTFALGGLGALCAFSDVGGGGAGGGIACMRRCISSIDTSSMCVPTVHLCP